MIDKILKVVYFIFVRVIPLTVLLCIGVFYCYRFSAVPLSIEREQIFFGLDITVATMAGLAFYASYTSKDENRKVLYYTSGEYLFKAAFLFVIDTFLQGVLFIFMKFNGFTFLNTYVMVVLTASITIVFIFALVNLFTGLNILLKYFGTHK